MTGIIGGVSINALKKIIIAFPPIAEQQRIVAKVDELMALCQELKNLDSPISPQPRIVEDIIPEVPSSATDEIGDRYAIAARGELPEETPDSLNKAIDNMFQRKKNA